MLSHTKSKILQELRKFDENTSIEFSEHSDFTSTLAFKLAKKEKRNPTVIAEEIAAQISKNLANDVEVKALNAYLNFYLTDKFYSENLPEILNFNFNKQDEKIILEHTSVNPSGPIHIGRIRNAIIGDCIGRTLKFCNYETEIHYYVNDMGKQIAIIALARHKNLKKNLKELSDLSDFIINFVRNDYEILPRYIAGNELYETNEEFKNQVDEIIRKAESGDKYAINLMKETAKFCLDGQRQALENMDIKFDKFDYESEFVENEKVNEVINHLCPDRKDNEPAEIDLEKYGIKREKGKIIIARSNGTSVYLTRDIAYHLYKINLINKFGSGKILNVLGEDHKQEFLELKTIMEKKFNVDTNISINAIFFSFVNFEGRKFSTRKGNIITIDELTNDAIEKAKNIMLEKNFATEGYKDIGIGAVKYAL
ncbi:MAG: arginine--tRNA ligase, partial [Candidatus Altarchaeum sp.]|nr:arginine--tRNA ligase [Candidatus Altarchaeum sp.]